jgi:hypothetical protein
VLPGSSASVMRRTLYPRARIYRPRSLTRWLRAPPLRVNTYAAPVAGGLSAPTVGSWGLLLLLRAAFLGALRWLRRAAPHGLQRLFVLRSTALSR